MPAGEGASTSSGSGGGGAAAAAAAAPPPAPPRNTATARALPPHEHAAKVREYEAFADGALRSRLEAAHARRAALEQEQNELLELARTLEGMAADQEQQQQQQQADGAPVAGGPLKTLVDLGAGVHCAARVRDPSRVCVAVGLGFLVEAPLAEAAAIARARAAALQPKVDACLDDAARVRTHIRFVFEAVGELQQLGRAAERGGGAGVR